jgi:hypothetical protein
MDEMSHERRRAPCHRPSNTDTRFVIIKKKSNAFPHQKKHGAVETSGESKPLQRTSRCELREF